MSEEREALAVQWPVANDGLGLYVAVGKKLWQPDALNDGAVEGAGVVTRITVTNDLPGLHGNMERIRVYCGEQVAMEAPVHAVDVVQYQVKPEDPAWTE